MSETFTETQFSFFPGTNVASFYAVIDTWEDKAVVVVTWNSFWWNIFMVTAISDREMKTLWKKSLRFMFFSSLSKKKFNQNINMINFLKIFLFNRLSFLLQVFCYYWYSGTLNCSVSIQTPFLVNGTACFDNINNFYNTKNTFHLVTSGVCFQIDI